MSTENPKDGRDRDPLAERTAALPREIQPSRELWPGVANRIRQSDPRAAEASSTSERGRSWRPDWFASFRPSWGTVAVAAGLAAILSAGLTAVLVKSRPAPFYSESLSALATLDGIAAECARIRRDLDLDDTDTYLSEETRAVIETNLQIVELAATESREALASDPRNAGLARKAAADYQNQLALLRKAAQLSNVDNAEPEAPSTSPRESET